MVADVYVGEDQTWGLIDRLRNRYPDLPVMITSAADEADAAYAHGAARFLPKPMDRELLLQELRRLTSTSGTRRLLIVDDNEVARYILGELLSQPWLQIQEASNGTEALARLSEGPPDAMILDLLMPDLSGFEILRQLRAKPETASLPVLIYTSKPLNEAERAQLESLNASIVRKGDVSTRLSAQPFLDWLSSVDVSPKISTGNHDA